MTISTQFASQAQALDDLVDLLPPLDEIVSDDFDPITAGDLTITHPFWRIRFESLEVNMTRNAILHAWRVGAMGSAETILALIQYDALDFETAAQLLSDHAMTRGKRPSTGEAPDSEMGRAV